MPVNILVADDSVTMRRIIELTFAGEDAVVVTVDSGDACINKASANPPDVVFADCSLPGMDGYALAANLKSSPGLENVAVIAMASQKHPFDDSKGKASGVDDHIVKPFDTQHVLDKLRQVLSRPRAVVQVRPAAAAPKQALPMPAAPAMPSAAPQRPKSATIAFGKPPAPPMAMPSASPAPRAAQHSSPVAAAVASVAAATAASGGAYNELGQKLAGLGLTPDQINGVLSLSREVVERVVWEVVPDLAETLIKEEIRRLTAE